MNDDIEQEVDRLSARRCVPALSKLQLLVDAKWRGYRELGKDKRGFTKEDALIYILELLDCNSCDIELTSDEYQELSR